MNADDLYILFTHDWFFFIDNYLKQELDDFIEQTIKKNKEDIVNIIYNLKYNKLNHYIYIDYPFDNEQKAKEIQKEYKEIPLKIYKINISLNNVYYLGMDENDIDFNNYSINYEGICDYLKNKKRDYLKAHANPIEYAFKFCQDIYKKIQEEINNHDKKLELIIEMFSSFFQNIVFNNLIPKYLFFKDSSSKKLDKLSQIYLTLKNKTKG